MRYLQAGGFQSHPLMRLTLYFTLLFFAGLWMTNFAMWFSRMSLTPSSVAAYYLGSAEDFSAPRSAASMLEVTHSHLPVMAIVVLMMTHLMIFAPFDDRAKVWLISAAFLSALLEEGSGWLVRFAHPAFAWLKIASFLSLQALLALMMAGLLRFLREAAHARKKGHHGDLI